MDRKLTLEIEELEERIAPGPFNVIPPAATGVTLPTGIADVLSAGGRPHGAGTEVMGLVTADASTATLGVINHPPG